MRRWLGLVLLALVGPVLAAGTANTKLVLPKGSRIGIVSLLDAAVTHYHAAKELEGSFMKTQFVSWNIDAMLAAVLKDRLADLGLVEVPLSANDALNKTRDTCFLNAALAKGLPRECGPAFADLAATQRLDAIIVLGPGLNDSAHGKRRKELPDYLRGWGFYTRVGGSDDKPELFNMTELVLVSTAGQTVKLAAREWGGSYEQQWSSFTGQLDQRAVPNDQLGQLVPLFGDVLSRQCSRLLDQVDVR
jgi:hypothetical protein